MADVFDGIFGQPKVREFLRSCVRGNRVSHAYLFTGPAGSNKTAAAFALAKAILCASDPCGNCEGCTADTCRRIDRKSHPDVHYLAPEGAQGYVVEQIRELVADAQLAPLASNHKVYILDRVDALGTSAANAFLKTLEEPPEDVTIILLGRTREAVLPTIVSRCQVVPFRHIPASEAAIAIQAVGGSITKAAQFLRSKERGVFRTKIMSALGSLCRADDLDILDYARDLVLASKSPLDEVRREQERDLEEKAEFLQASALKQLEARQKRAMSAASMELLRQMCAMSHAWLRDVGVCCAGDDSLIVNVDVAAAIRDAAGRTTLERVTRAQACVAACEDAISYNVSPQVSIEAMLFEIREVLYA